MRDNNARIWRFLSTYTGMKCPYSSPFTLSNYKRDAYTIILVLKSGWWWPITFEKTVIVLSNSETA